MFFSTILCVVNKHGNTLVAVTFPSCLKISNMWIDCTPAPRALVATFRTNEHADAPHMTFVYELKTFNFWTNYIHFNSHKFCSNYTKSLTMNIVRTLTSRPSLISNCVDHFRAGTSKILGFFSVLDRFIIFSWFMEFNNTQIINTVYDSSCNFNKIFPFHSSKEQRQRRAKIARNRTKVWLRQK